MGCRENDRRNCPDKSSQKALFSPHPGQGNPVRITIGQKARNRNLVMI
jgi:hypothetical protein